MKKGDSVSYTMIGGETGTGKVFKKFLKYVIIQDKRSGIVVINKNRVTKV